MALSLNNMVFSAAVQGYGTAGSTGTGTATGRGSGRLTYQQQVDAQWTSTLLASNQITTNGLATGTLAASGYVDIDLYGGTLLDYESNPIIMTSLKLAVIFLITADGDVGTAGQITIGGTGPSNIHKMWFGDTSDLSTVEVGGPCFCQGATAGKTVDATHRNIRILNSSGVTAYYAAVFSGLALPVLTGISPATGPAAGATTVVISGSGFLGATAVSFGATAATSFVVNSPNQITAVSPAHAAGTVDITVTAPGGVTTTSAADQFVYT